MAAKRSSKKVKPAKPAALPSLAARPSALLDTRIVCCGDCLDQLGKLPDGCVDLVYIDLPSNSNRNYEVFWGDRAEPRPSGSGPRVNFDHRHASTAAYIEYVQPHCVERTVGPRALRWQTG
ncbi:hypothetical protein LCGC14_0908470 [marine sediment metagenome]|uniref:DNA methylase N-4/N-6 domain-containing protein n=1 Tax=marine sediment metagenome TaxID=412755 RepID=A0A0F9PF21_9ZZZZ